ncbi:MAG: GNAT family N-acetyltransferase [Acidobacteria bacterium]|nr:GNAT family N-acetyltransferase [Acidobacteriota bacterium]
MDVALTPRLRLRRLTHADAAFLLRLLNEPSFHENIGDRGVRTLEDARRYLDEGPLRSYVENGFGLYLVEERATGTALGMCGLIRRPALEHVDLGFAFIPEAWGRGYATEAGTAVLAHGLDELGLETLVAITAPHNLGSKRVLGKLGFVFERRLRLPGDATDIELFVLEPESRRR